MKTDTDPKDCMKGCKKHAAVKYTKEMIKYYKSEYGEDWSCGLKHIGHALCCLDVGDHKKDFRNRICNLSASTPSNRAQHDFSCHNPLFHWFSLLRIFLLNIY